MMCIFLLLAVLLPDHAAASDVTANAAWVRYRWWIIGAGFFFILEALLIVFLLLNIQLRKKVEQDLRESEIRYRTVADYTYDWEYWVGPDGNLLYISPSCERVTGYGPGDFISDPGLLHAIVHPDDREVWGNHRREEHRGNELKSIRFRIIGKDGRLRWIDHTCIPVNNSGGRFMGYRAGNRDITEPKEAEDSLAQYRGQLEGLVRERTAELESEIAERRKKEAELDSYRINLEHIVQERTAELKAEITRRQKAQEALSISEAHLRRAQEVAILGSWYLDIPSNELFWSDVVYEIFGLSPGMPLSYEDFLNAIHPDDREYVNRSWNAAMQKQPYDIEHRVIVNGSIKWVREKAEVDFSEDGAPERGIGIVQDITRRKQAEEEQYKLTQTLAHVSRVATVGELTAALAHEINQPLAAILANAQAARHIIDQDVPDIQELRETLDDIISDDKRAREVIRRVRSLIRKESSMQEEADINEIIRESVRIISQDSVSKGVPVRMALQGELPRVTADKIQIGQVVINLLVNALEAAADDDGGPHTVIVQSMTDSEGNVAVSVKDTGKGIDENSLHRLFEPFYTTKTHGLGLGLSISRSIIEAHRGKLTALPNPGRGAAFTFSLPGKPLGETI